MTGSFSEIFWSAQAGLPLLLILQLLPLLGAAVVFAFNERSTAVVAGKVFALAELLLCIVVASRIDPVSPALQMAERFAQLAEPVGAPLPRLRDLRVKHDNEIGRAHV